MPKREFLNPHGNYRELLSYKKVEIIYDLTFHFTEKSYSFLTFLSTRQIKA